MIIFKSGIELSTEFGNKLAFHNCFIDNLPTSQPKMASAHPDLIILDGAISKI